MVRVGCVLGFSKFVKKITTRVEISATMVQDFRIGDAFGPKVGILMGKD